MVMDPTPRPGEPSLSVMATTWKRGKTSSKYVTDKGFLPGDLPIEEYERLQGVPGMTASMIKAGSSRSFAVHLLGNGVPLAMGRYIATEFMKARAHDAMLALNKDYDDRKAKRSKTA